MAGQVAAIGVKATVEVGLAAAGLGLGKIDLDTEASEKLDLGDSGVRKKRVAQTSDHQGHFQARFPQCEGCQAASGSPSLYKKRTGRVAENTPCSWRRSASLTSMVEDEFGTIEECPVDVTVSSGSIGGGRNVTHETICFLLIRQARQHQLV